MENNFFALLKEQFPGVESKDTVVRVPQEKFISLMTFLRQKGFNYLSDLTAVDNPACFTLVYQVLSYDLPAQVTVKLDIPKESPAAASVTNLWASANWLEREVFDMFGIKFSGHPNMRRILMDDHFVGHPLRKSFIG